MLTARPRNRAHRQGLKTILDRRKGLAQHVPRYPLPHLAPVARRAVACSQKAQNIWRRGSSLRLRGENPACMFKLPQQAKVKLC